MMNQRRVEVAVRVRPTTAAARESACIALHHAAHHVEMVDPVGGTASAGRRRFSCDHLFGADASNHALFEELVLRKMHSATPAHPDTLCLLAYGHTSSGKTHSIAGSEQEPGVLALCVQELLRREGVVEAAMLEVYLDSVNDLLAHGEPRVIRRRQGAQGPAIVVEALTTCAVTSLEQWNAVAAFGMRARRTAPTERNSRSSRSHAIFTLKTRSVRLCLVDLAGSERQTIFSPQLNKESISINKSLSRLSTVLEALSNQRVTGDGTRSYVNFRDTTLTVLLQRYLTGASMTTFLACVHPSADSYQETLSTLRYTQRLKRIRTRATTADDVEWSAMMTPNDQQTLRDELARLREQMKTAESTTKLIEAAHRRRIAELEGALAIQRGAVSGRSASPAERLDDVRARDTRRVAGWLLSRVLGDLPALNVGYDAYFDHYFPVSVQVIGYVTAMASLVPRAECDEPLACLDVGDVAVGLSMLDAGVPPFIRLHCAGCGDPRVWERCEWEGASDAVYVLVFFESHATAMAAATDAADALPCCGGYVTAAPLLPIATVLCVATSAHRRVKEEVLQRLVDLQHEQHEALAEHATGTSSITSSLASSASSSPPSRRSHAAAAAAAAHVDAAAAASPAGPLALEVRRQAADRAHIAVPFNSDDDDGDDHDSVRSSAPPQSAEPPCAVDVRRDLLGDCSAPAPPPPPPPPESPPRVSPAQEPTAGERAAVVVPAPPPSSACPPPSVAEAPPPPRSDRRRRTSADEGRAVRMQSCQGCSCL
ncbi:kinesin [Novymonas esmeraldas]|uniref:Kinesin n=1 Tax=Novymonas esmeraldas TaxID=1808958 RepID=A0AAW0EZT9_9TRYP